MDLFGRIIATLYCLSILILKDSNIECFDCKLFPPFISEHLDDYWYRFKTQFNKTYSSQQNGIRRMIWEQNLHRIYYHNLLAAAGHFNFTLRDNFLADISTHDYLKDLTTLIPSRRFPLLDDHLVGAIHHNPDDVPQSLDWRQKGFVTPVEDQRDCGSCYAYSIARSVQGQIFKNRNQMISLSVQQLLDCSTETGNLGCVGGSLRNTLRYLEKSKGIMDEYHYPYMAMQGECKFQNYNSVVNISSWALLPVNDERTMQAAVAEIGPIAASINASPKTFQLYHNGVYDDPECTDNIVNHAVLIVGYTPEYWIIKNWWGSEWGENGYMRLAKMKNMCGITNFAAYVKI